VDAIVTGSSSGIGKAIAQALLEGGWSVTGFDVATPSIEHARSRHVRVDLCDGDAAERAQRP
jgi:nucleoside-diphosphate-sugar epimerase